MWETFSNVVQRFGMLSPVILGLRARPSGTWGSLCWQIYHMPSWMVQRLLTRSPILASLEKPGGSTKDLHWGVRPQSYQALPTTLLQLAYESFCGLYTFLKPVCSSLACVWHVQCPGSYSSKDFPHLQLSWLLLPVMNFKKPSTVSLFFEVLIYYSPKARSAADWMEKGQRLQELK